MALRLLIILAFIFSFSSCGYKWGNDGVLPQHAKIYVPFVEGDLYGELTSALIQEISRSGTFAYSTFQPDYDLVVAISQIKEENIGFRYQLDKNQEVTSLLVPSEMRLTLEVDVRVICRCSGECAIEPLKFVEFIDFDHDYYSSHNATNILSLGQLTEIEEAQDIATRPLYRRLARRIVDGLESL